MKSISSNSKFLGIVLGRGWEGGDVENIYQEKRAGADEPVGSTTEGWAWMWAKVWRLPNLVLLGQSFSTAYSSSGIFLRVEFENLNFFKSFPGDSYAL